MNFKSLALAIVVGVLPASTHAIDMSPAQKRMVQLFTNNKSEPAAKDAVWTSSDIFKVGVLDNHAPRDGYASYVCEVLYEHGFKGQKIWVQIIDIAKLVRTDKWVKLGEAHCL